VFAATILQKLINRFVRVNFDVHEFLAAQTVLLKVEDAHLGLASKTDVSVVPKSFEIGLLKSTTYRRQN
jgi:hypothetical protein